MSDSVPPSSIRLQTTLKTLQAQLSAAAGRPLKQGELAHIADMNPRSFGEWMRGATSPASVQALLRLLSEVPAQELSPLLKPWNGGRVQAFAKGVEATAPIHIAHSHKSAPRRKKRRQSKAHQPRGK